MSTFGSDDEVGFGNNKELSNFWGKKKFSEPDEAVEPDVGVPMKTHAINLEATPTQQEFTSKITTHTPKHNDELHLDELLGRLLESGSSDLHLTATAPPMMRKHGDITPMEGFPPLSSEQIQRLMFSILTGSQQKEFEQNKELDMAYSLPGRSRFRVNILRQRGQVGSVIRTIPHDIKSLEQLGMPAILNSFASLPRGLVLVTGPTGSGKSTTLAGIIDQVNRTRKDNIITIEDPIEFVHQNKNCIVSQREVGTDTNSFAEALKHALRQDPDIILLGEMRDYETIGTAITAAETGHLVFGTLHTQSVAETMSRIIDAFPDGSKNQVQAQLAATLQGVVCQTLVKTLDGTGRVAATEILVATPSVRNLIRKGQGEQIRSALETGGKYGMQTMDGHLQQLVKENRISIDAASERATNVDAFLRSLGSDEEIQRIRRVQAELGGHSDQYFR